MIQARQHSDKLPSLLLSRRDQALLYSHVDAIFSKLETLDAHKGIIALHNGVSIWHRKHEGCQHVYVAPFPSRRFVILIAWTLYSSDLLELMLRHFIQTHQACGMESVFLLSHSFCVQMMVPDANLSVSSYQPWKNMYAEMIQFQVRVCVYVVLHCTS